MMWAARFGIAGLAAAMAAVVGAVPGVPEAGADEDGARVNLYVASDMPVLNPGERGVQPIDVGNRGPGPDSGPVTMVYATPFFWNVDRRVPLPPGCRLLLADERSFVPEVVRCDMSRGVTAGNTVRISIPLVVAEDAPTGPGYALVNVVPDQAAGSTATEVDYSDNAGGPGVTVVRPDRPAEPQDGPNLYVRTVTPIIRSDTDTPFDVLFGNTADTAPAGPVTLTVVMPFYVNTANRPLPDGCEYVLQDKNPVVPEVVLCQLPADFGEDSEQQLRLTVTSPAEGPRGTVFGNALVWTRDETDPPDNVLTFPVQLAR